jgi:TolB-like protein
MLPLEADAVRAQLDRILASPGFANADRLSRFLRFVVERTMEGEGDQLKEYRLGTEVFDRPADYDPRLDSIVRVEARRLRSKLAEYYEGPNRTDPIVIRVDKGSYVATFEANAAPEPAPAPAPAGSADGPDRALDTSPPSAAVKAPALARRPWRELAVWGGLALVVGVGAWWLATRDTASASGKVQVAVLPLVRYDAVNEPVPDALADAVTDGLIGELARQPGLEVASRTTVMRYRTRPERLSTIANDLGVQAIVEGRVQVTGPRLWIELRVVDGRRDRKVWVDDFAGETANRRELERRVAAEVGRVLTTRFAPGQPAPQ